MKVVYNKQPLSHLMYKIIEALEELTRVEWGYQMRARRVDCITSREVPIRVGVRWGKPYEALCKPLDIEVTCKTPRAFPSTAEWEQALRDELRGALLRQELREDILEAVKGWVPTGEYAMMMAVAQEQISKWPLEVGPHSDEWITECNSL